MKNLILLIISAGLTIILGLFLLLFGIICCGITQSLPSYYIRLAIAIDAMGNVLGYPLFNLVLIKKGGYKFGNRRDTISYVLGMNKEINKLSKLGRGIASTLNKIDKNHVERAAGFM